MSVLNHELWLLFVFLWLNCTTCSLCTFVVVLFSFIFIFVRVFNFAFQIWHNCICFMFYSEQRANWFCINANRQNENKKRKFKSDRLRLDSMWLQSVRGSECFINRLLCVVKLFDIMAMIRSPMEYFFSIACFQLYLHYDSSSNFYRASQCE